MKLNFLLFLFFIFIGHIVSSQDLSNISLTVIKSENSTYNSEYHDLSFEQHMRASIFKQNSKEDYRRRSKKHLVGGIITTSIGTALLASGGFLLSLGIENMSYYDIDEDLYYDGVIYTIAGAAMAVSSIPLLIVGPIQFGKSAKFKRLAKNSKSDVGKISLKPVLAPRYDSFSGTIGIKTGAIINF